MKQMQMEIWKEIDGYKGMYQVSNLGRVKSLKFGKERLLKFKLNMHGYLQVNLSKDGKALNKRIHRLIITAFIANSENKPSVNHKNGIKTDNRIENLEWSTISENTQHAYDNVLSVGPKGDKNGQAKITDNQAMEIKYNHKGMTQESIAKIYGISYSMVSMIRSGKKWSHI